MDQLSRLANCLKESKSLHEKISLLNRHCTFEKLGSSLCGCLDKLSPEQQIAIKQVAAIDQLPCSSWEVSFEQLQKLADQLISIDNFYNDLGGIAGYQLQVRNLLNPHLSPMREKVSYHAPFLIDISQMKRETNKMIEAGIAALPLLSEILPLGGAADRLHLRDEATGDELPAAKLEFAGHTLLEKILRDLAAREHLYFKRTGVVLTTPVAIMTSLEKNNWQHVQEILEKNRWFGRPKESFRSFEQPLVPIVNRSDGSWHWTAPWTLLLKPGGHGAIWKLAKDRGIFNWLRSLGAKYALIRQINNPLAGVDYGLLAFSGIGVSRKMSFGFSSCPRIPNAAEGMNVMVEKKTAAGTFYSVSNIEYCDFKKYDLAEDCPFTANTNILFAELSALESAVSRSPFPGLLLNFKNDLGRLESTMQNISDVFVEKHRSFPKKGLKKVFVTYNVRHKTISPAKKAFSPDLSFNETPENSFYDLMRAHRDLLLFCGMDLPPEKTLVDTLASSPAFTFLYHPGLGPQFKTIAEKIRGGTLAQGSELLLEIAEGSFVDLNLSGSLQVYAGNPLGEAKCILDQVTVENRGVDWDHSKPFWKGKPKRLETVHIELEGHSEFIARNVAFQGSHHFKVKDGERLVVHQESKGLKVVKTTF